MNTNPNHRLGKIMMGTALSLTIALSTGTLFSNSHTAYAASASVGSNCVIAVCTNSDARQRALEMVATISVSFPFPEQELFHGTAGARRPTRGDPGAPAGGALAGTAGRWPGWPVK